ncbi:MAG: ATP-dependent RNA helicase HrpA, partial [Gammaproteobacteria bacterium]|nr:ATP-dependent RNA helicase HrpA [Gammaproteobacteria bacterium]
MTVLNNLDKTFSTCLLKDQPHFLRRWRGLKKRAQQGKPHSHDLEKLQTQIKTSQQRLAQRIENSPKPEYADNLPVVAAKEEIMDCIEKHQVLILCGETGSGKTTQLPKICLELGRGCKGLIGHTQPRRLAARSVAARIADELKSELGGSVGYKVRFGSQINDQQGYIKLMTDGILLAEIQSDPLLWQYDTLIIDEAHERSLNIDFLLGYFKQLLPKRPDLKLIITSATIDPERFASHFQNAPILKVEGRSYPVEVRYRPLYNDQNDEQDRNQNQAILDSVDELSREPLGDILIFLAGEREIRDTAEALRRHALPHTEILPLFARLSNSEQQKIFKPHRGRHIVLATNVAETSLTVPGIRYVIDPGLARISRYSLRSKLQRLPIEKVSQASANQRKGRCGRVAAGICIRLYDEEDFLQRPEFTEPEIQRTNLAAVILQMSSLKLGKIDHFPFVDRPDHRLINDGYRLLHELSAVNPERQLTPLGVKLARLPIDPRLGRMLLAADQEGCLKEVLIIVSALAVQDPRERPLEKQQAADQAHALHRHPQSDFLGLLNLWNHYQQLASELSQNRLRKQCKSLFVSYLRMREWIETHKQLRGLMSEMKHRSNDNEAEYDAIHRALLSGLISHVALKGEEREYLGTRNRKLHIFPGSGLAKKGPKWIMSAEVTETGRVYARTVAKIDPLWIEKIAPELLSRSYFEVHWQKRNAQVGAYEKSALYGLIINEKKRINYGPINPAEAHEIFLREALVNGNYQTKADFYHHNQALLAEVEQLEAKSRRRDILIDEEQLYDFYAQRIPSEIYNGPAFERWRKKTEQNEPKMLHLQVEELMQHDAEQVTDERFPDQFDVAGAHLPLSYHFEPGSDDDGITLKVPLAILNQIPSGRCEWLVPGLLEEKMIALIKSLPKNLRRNFVPAPNYAQACLQALTPSNTPLSQAMAEHLLRMSGVRVPNESWQAANVPLHLQMRFEIVDAKG